jgi:hypothetical protein
MTRPIYLTCQFSWGDGLTHLCFQFQNYKLNSWMSIAHHASAIRLRLPAVGDQSVFEKANESITGRQKPCWRAFYCK